MICRVLEAGACRRTQTLILNRNRIGPAGVQRRVWSGDIQRPKIKLTSGSFLPGEIPFGRSKRVHKSLDDPTGARGASVARRAMSSPLISSLLVLSLSWQPVGVGWRAHQTLALSHTHAATQRSRCARPSKLHGGFTKTALAVGGGVSGLSCALEPAAAQRSR